MMRVLFVCSGNGAKISPIIENQANSIMEEGTKVDFFLIKGKGISGYLGSILPLYTYMQTYKYDIVHAHYSLSAFVASLAGAKPLVVSLMGSDVKSKKYFKLIIRLFAWIYSWSAIIVKSQDMYNNLKMRKANIIPNGVDFSRFKPLDKIDSQQRLGWDCDKIHILFPSNPVRKEKNYNLAIAALKTSLLNNWEIHTLVNVPNEDIPLWCNAASVVLMTSLWEGSPNAIKEAMACNRPIVSTDVGDVRYLFGETDGCYITSRDKENCISQIRKAIQFSKEHPQTKGRSRLINLGLDIHQVAQQILRIYESCKNNK